MTNHRLIDQRFSTCIAHIRQLVRCMHLTVMSIYMCALSKTYTLNNELHLTTSIYSICQVQACKGLITCLFTHHCPPPPPPPNSNKTKSKPSNYTCIVSPSFFVNFLPSLVQGAGDCMIILPEVQVPTSSS